MFASLLTLSPLALILGILISVISVVEAFVGGKTWKELMPKIVTAALAISLLFVQAATNKRSSAQSSAQLDAALKFQKKQITSDLTRAFNTGTDQVIKLAGQEADKTRKAADSQSNAIERQAVAEGNRLQSASEGSDLCPRVGLTSSGNNRPDGLIVINDDKTANIYDMVLWVQEGEHAGNGKDFRTLQDKKLTFPTIYKAYSPSQPFLLLSNRTTSYIQFTLATRRKVCSGQIVVHNDGNGHWYPQLYPVHEGPLFNHNTEVPPEDQEWNPSMIPQ